MEVGMAGPLESPKTESRVAAAPGVIITQSRAESPKTESRVASLMAYIFAAVIAVMAAIIFLAAIWNVFFVLPERGAILKDHFAAIIGVPVSAAFAFLIVVFLRQTEGPIEFTGLGFDFKGASGQVAMWVVCFLAIAGALKLLW
jgi:hypothetical protein